MSATITLANGRTFNVVNGEATRSPRGELPRPAPSSATPPTPNKYRNKRVYVTDGLRFSTRREAEAYAARTKTGGHIIFFPSIAEADRHDELVLLERGGKIRDLKRQPRFPLKVDGVHVCTYVGDWRYEEITDYEDPNADGVWLRETADVVEDRKGALTPAFKIKWALAKALHPEIEWRLS